MRTILLAIGAVSFIGYLIWLIVSIKNWDSKIPPVVGIVLSIVIILGELFSMGTILLGVGIISLISSLIWLVVCVRNLDSQIPSIISLGLSGIMIFGALSTTSGISVKNPFINNDSRLAYENCLTLQAMLKDPDSFKLYSDIEILRIYESGSKEPVGEYMFIDYGGANSYGAMVRTTAGFIGEVYIADLEDDIEDIPVSKRADYIIVAAAKVSYERYGEEKNPSGAHIERTIISKEKIIKKL